MQNQTPKKKNWENIKFKSFITLQRGFDLPQQNITEGPYPILGSTTILGYHDEYKAEPPGVTTGRSGSLGSVLYTNKKYWPHNTSLWVKNFKRNVPRFVYYFLTSFPLNSFNSGAGVPTLNRNHLNEHEVLIPEAPIQQKIASILSAFDDLIENNNKRIEILEEMAQLLYREWFVEFRFPGYEKVKMVDSELGKIPEGWKVEKLESVLEELESGRRPKGGIDTDENEVPSIGAENILGLGRYDYSKDKFVSENFYNSMKKGKIRSRDVLLYKDGAQIGRKSMFRDGFPYDKCCINEHVFILRTNDRCSQNYLYLWLDLPFMTDTLINSNTNAAQPGINQEDIRRLLILIPPDNLMEKFERIADPIIELLFNLAKNNINLSKMRDLLLPKLMSGEIEVA